jgi:hypothetical protein
MRALEEEEVSLLFIIDLGTRWRWVVSVRPRRRFTPEKGPPVPTGQEARCVPQPVWTQRLEKKSFRLSRESKSDSSVVHFAARHYTDWATPAPFVLNSSTVYCSILFADAVSALVPRATSADCTRTHHTRQHSLVCFSFYLSRHRQNLISIPSASHERRNRPVKSDVYRFEPKRNGSKGK